MAGLTAELTEPNSTECDDRFGSGTWLIPFRGCLLISMSICSTPDAVAAGRPCKGLSVQPQRMRNGAERWSRRSPVPRLGSGLTGPRHRM